MKPINCPDPMAFSIWYDSLVAMSVLLLLAALVALFTLWQARYKGMRIVLSAALNALVAAVIGVASSLLWLRFRTTLANLSAYYPLYPSNCISADEYYGHFSPPSGFYDVLQQTIAQVAPLEQAAMVDVALAAVILVATAVGAIRWMRRQMPTPGAA